MGIGFEVYQWAAERGLEIPLLIFLLVLTIVLIIIMNYNNKSDSTSICRDCMYKKRKQGTGVLSCNLYKHKPLFIRKQQIECPVDQLRGNEPITSFMSENR